jgi:argininosuccinate lyase
VLRRLNDSLVVDSRLYQEDIRGSKAWAQELHSSGHLSLEDHKAIQEGLDKVNAEKISTAFEILFSRQLTLNSLVQR